MFKTRGGGKGRLNNVKKTALFSNVGFPKLSGSVCNVNRISTEQLALSMPGQKAIRL